MNKNVNMTHCYRDSAISHENIEVYRMRQQQNRTNAENDERDILSVCGNN